MGKTKRVPPNTFDFDVICIGSGSAGGTVANLANQLNKKVAIIEGTHFGGESPRYSSIPVNALLQVVKSLAIIKQSPALGIDGGRFHLNWQKALKFKNECIQATGVAESSQAFEKLGITLYQGFGQFLDAWTLSINRQSLKAAKIVIATGAKNFIPDIKGLKEGTYLTYKEALDLPELPKSIFIIGAGMTGCALAEIFNAFGSRVYLADMSNHLLNSEDVEIGQVQAEIFKNKGIHILLSCQISQINNQESSQKEVIIQDFNGVKNILVEQVIVAAGRIPQTDLDLANTDVQVTPSGIKVNRYLETTMPHIYAIGDVIGHHMSTYMAAQQARLIVHNMYQKKAKHKLSYQPQYIPRYLALNPEIAVCGFNEKELSQRHIAYKKAIVPIHDNDCSYLSQHEAGFVKLLSTPHGTLLGGSMIAPGAGEIINQLNLAIKYNLSVADLKNTLKPFPTWSETLNLACQKL